MKDGMHDNRMVKDSHQEGIGRKLQRKSDYYKGDCVGHQGSMAKGWGHGVSDKGFKRGGDSLTPRKA